MANEQNLKPFTSDQNREEARKNGKKGGIASGEARRRKREMKDTINIILGMPLKDGQKAIDIESVKSYASLSGKNVSTEEALILMMIKKALKGDAKAFEIIRDTAGQKPVDKIAVAEVEQSVIDEVEAIVLKNTEQ